jgi:hypothetical protein
MVVGHSHPVDSPLIPPGTHAGKVELAEVLQPAPEGLSC